MKPEKQFLIDDLLDDAQCDARREATLLAGGKILRHRRWKHAASRGLMLAAVIAMAAVLQTKFRDSARPPQPAQTASAPAPTQPQFISDDELLALFPDTPVGLITKADGKKRLVFLRPGDEQRFITRL